MDFIAMISDLHCLTRFLLTRKEGNQSLAAASSKSHQAHSQFSILQCQQSHLVVFTVIYMCSKWLKSSNFKCRKWRIQLGVSHHPLLRACVYTPTAILGAEIRIYEALMPFVKQHVFYHLFWEFLSPGAWKMRKPKSSRSVRGNKIFLHPVNNLTASSN